MPYNIAKALKAFEVANNQTIEAIVVGPHDADRYGDPDRRPEKQRDVIISREDGLKLLDEDYNNGYGGADCFPMYAWTQDYVLSIGEYDGATGLRWLPRNPINCTPKFS